MRNSLDRAVAYAQILASLVAFGALVSLALQIHRQRRDARAEWTLSYQQTYNDRGFRTIHSKCTGFFDADDAADCVSKIKALREAGWADEASLPRTPPAGTDAQASNNDLRYLLGFFETLGLAYNSAKIDRGLIVKLIAAPAVYSLMDSWWYICWRRDGDPVGESHLYEQFEQFVKSVRKARAHLKDAADPKPTLRFLCLPPGGSRDAEWELAGQLSKELSERAKGLPGVPQALVARVKQVVEAIEAQRGGAVTPLPHAQIETVIVVPHDIDVPAAAWRQHRGRAQTIHDLLLRLSQDELEDAVSSL